MTTLPPFKEKKNKIREKKKDKKKKVLGVCPDKEARFLRCWHMVTVHMRRTIEIKTPHGAKLR